ncbi:CcdB family protein [Novosphingobium lentum]|uniref:CcdB family protein n=1 Tax=Novosphingobium lentum TaxID=145287 RepID=UPI0008313BF3|nr:CcdB family protein [Novosphingobium lentum]
MAKFDVYRQVGTGPLVLDCQADLLDGLTTRLVVPLLPEAHVPKPIARLHPVFAIDGERLVMATHLASAIAVRELGARVVSLLPKQDAIGNALDMLIAGF